MNAAIISQFDNPTDGLRTVVVGCDLGFQVILSDTDANLTLPTSRIFPTLERAESYARQIIEL